ncbi:MAG: hypothetical protein L6R39_001399 [Caloplaca ligustica]|nr:MAG: hypothetical protein L6R39_001399 [Caloplaca ligustica]
MSFLTRTSPMSLFPIFLVPPIPFRRRRKSSTDSSSSGDGTSSSHVQTTTTTTKHGYLSGHTSHLRCARCATDLCPTSQIISKGFTGRHGRAYLVSASPVVTATDATATYDQSRHGAKRCASLPNTRTHKAVPRQLVTGAHTVSDVSCAFCGSVLGWKYDSAEEETQRYKVGKYILETKKIFSSSCWEGYGVENEDGGGGVMAGGKGRLRDEGGPRAWEDEVEFDSQDEDECEDLFAGVWSPTLAVRRRQGKRFERTVCEGPGRPQVV